MDKALRILIIEDESSVCNRFQAEIEDTIDMKCVACTASSTEAVTLVQTHLPDVVVLDLELTNGQGNGLDFLQRLKQVSLAISPYIVVTTNNSSTITHDCARELGADFIFYKHQDDYSESAVLEFLRTTANVILRMQKQYNPHSKKTESLAERHQRLRSKITAHLHVVGINPKHKGFTYLVDAILYTIDGNTDSVSAYLSEKYRKSKTSVERAMQHAIEHTWRNTDINTLLEHYTANISAERGVPTMTEFICYYANILRE